MEYSENKESHERATEKLMNDDYETYTIIFDRRTKVGTLNSLFYCLHL